MSWLSDLVGPKLREIVGSERDQEEGDTCECELCGAADDAAVFAENLQVCPACGAHLHLSLPHRLKSLFDDGMFHLIALMPNERDPLRFRDTRRYTDRLREAQASSVDTDALVAARGTLGGDPVIVAGVDTDFLDGSVGMAGVEAIRAAARLALMQSVPFVFLAPMTGMRVQEGSFATAQVWDLAAIMADLRAGGVPTIRVRPAPDTDPGPGRDLVPCDVIIAEKGVSGASAADIVVERAALRLELERIITLLSRRRPMASVHALHAPVPTAGHALNDPSEGAADSD